MPMHLDEAREEFAIFLREDPNGKWRMDKAFAHVIAQAYQRGYNEGISDKAKQGEGLAPPTS